MKTHVDELSHGLFSEINSLKKLDIQTGIQGGSSRTYFLVDAVDAENEEIIKVKKKLLESFKEHDELKKRFLLRMEELNQKIKNVLTKIGQEEK